MLGGDGLLAVLGLHRAGLGVGECRPAFDHAHLRALEQRGDAGVQLVDDAFFPLHRLGEVELRRGLRA